MPSPFQLVGTLVERRQMAAVRIDDGAGNQGYGYGYTRGLPMSELVAAVWRDLASSHFSGMATFHEFRRRHVWVWPAYGRAYSLIDIALWDLVARREGVPIQVLLASGTDVDRVPAVPVVGYRSQEPGAVVDDILAFAQGGFTSMKLAGVWHSVGDLVEILARYEREAARAVDLIVDAHYRFETKEKSHDFIAMLNEFPSVKFVEDPVPPILHPVVQRSPSWGSIGLALGEDLTDPEAVSSLAQSVQLLRVDMTVVGGISGTATVADQIRNNEVPVLPHLFPGAHGRLARLWRHPYGVEFIPEAEGADPIQDYLTEPACYEQGEYVLSEQPGAATKLDWTRLINESLGAQTWVIGTDAR